MISLARSYEEYEEIRKIIKGVKDLDTLVALISDNNKFCITNDLRETKKMIDFNYKSLCITIKQNGNDLSITGYTEIWSDTTCTMISLNLGSFYKYRTRITEHNEVYCYSLHPYDNQDYHYSYNNKIYRNGKLIDIVAKEEMYDEMSYADNMILKLMQLDEKLESKMCHF